MLKITDLKAGYDPGSLILNGVSFELAAGKTLGIIGLNGCGKSTLGKALMNMVPFRQGQIIFGTKDISRYSPHDNVRSGINMVLQGGRVFANMTVREHLKLSLGELQALPESGLAEIEDKYGFSFRAENIAMSQFAGNLSGGQRGLLVLTMALLKSPRLLILDEISAGLSPVSLKKVHAVLETLRKEEKLSIIFIEQNIKMAVALSDNILRLERGQIAELYTINDQFDINRINFQIFK